MQCKHKVRLKGICCLCGQEVFGSEKEFCQLTSTDIIKTTYYKEKEITLVIDLDETILSTTSVALNEVDSSLVDLLISNEIFHLIIEEKEYFFDLFFIFNNFIYLIKFRENTFEFLKEASLLFKLFIFSMGTKPYVEKIKEYLINKEIKIEGSISREENMSYTKSVLRLGLSERRVIIIDDRIDVWNYFHGVILIKPYIYHQHKQINTQINKRIKLEDKFIEKKGIYVNKNLFDGETNDKILNNKSKKDDKILSNELEIKKAFFPKTDLLSLIPFLKKIRKKFRKIKNIKRILIKEKKKIFKGVELFFGLDDELIHLAHFYKIKFIKIIKNITLLENCILMKKEGFIYQINKDWFINSIYARKMINTEGFIKDKKEIIELSSEINEEEYL